MQDAWKRWLRVAGYAVMAIAIAHCGDNSNNNNGTPPGPTNTQTTATPTPVVTSPPETPTGELSPTVSPTAEGNPCPAAISVEGNATNSRLDSGWTGLAHDSKIIDRGKVTVATDCGGNARPCGVCNLSGPIANPDAGAGTQDNRRCSGDSSMECTSDGDCSGAGTCIFYFGAPLPLAAGGVSTCVVNQIVGEITGTANIETGESASSVHLTSSVFTGPVLDQPCPTCEGDTTIADGQRDGTCNGGQRDGMPCDVGGVSATFEPNGKTSLDCPPLSGGKIGALPIDLSNSTGTASRTLSSDNPDCRAASGQKCFCDTCATADAEPCSTNADCPGGAACGGLRCRGGSNNGATCTTPGLSTDCPGGACGVPGQASAPNACDNGTTCDAIGGTNSGECSGGPFEQYCSPHDTFRSCTGDADCPFAGDTCSLGKNRPCFLDNGMIGGSVSATGAPEVPVNGVSHPTLASLFCIAPTSSAAVNSAAGLPGLGRLQLNATAQEIAP